MNLRKHRLGLLTVEIDLEISQSCVMQEQFPPKKAYQDNWGTGAREGYEDLGAFRQRRESQKEPGSPILRGLGGISIVGGIFWGVYLVFYQGGVMALMENYGPIAVIALGAVCSVMGKYLRV